MAASLSQSLSREDSAVKFLVVEDNSGDAYLITRLLRSVFPDCEVDHREDLGSVFADRPCQGYTAVLSDLSLPDAQGLETVRLLGEYMPTLPIIVLTCLEDDKTALETLDHGAQDYLPKQEVLMDMKAGADKLARAIRYAIRRQELHKEKQLLVLELKESQKLLEGKNKRLEHLCDSAQRFVDNVSHEFRTPLTVIKEYSSLIRDGIVGVVNPEQMRMLNVIDDRTDDLNNMVDDLLDVSRLEAGLLGLCRQEHNLHDIVNYSMPSLMRKAEVRDTTLTVKIREPLPEIWCDDEKIGRVIINLVVNAIKFCGNPGVVELSAEANDATREVVVSVSDNGPGIPAGKLEEIFKRFEQPVSTVRQSTKGFGLGLNIAKELTDLNLGKMQVHSQVGKGSTFAFTVPYADRREILQRQFDRIRLEKKGAEICLAAISTSSQAESRDFDDVSIMLKHDLRNCDQLFRVKPFQWLAVLTISPLEFKSFVARLESDHRDASRNRPKGDLPHLRIDYRGVWRLDDCTNEEIIQAVEEYFDQKEPQDVRKTKKSAYC
jgi:signal transduction histidine kinase